jgi:hypothetical protein
MFPLLDESDYPFGFFIISLEKRRSCETISTPLSYVKLVATWQHFFKINDLVKISGNIFGNKVATWQQLSFTSFIPIF